jgi:hypothetical protein
MQLRHGIWRKSRRAFELSGRAGEVACCDGMCCPVFGKMQIQPLVALLPTRSLTSLQPIILSGVGEVTSRKCFAGYIDAFASCLFE